jgi:signal transduction histidine kinase
MPRPLTRVRLRVKLTLSCVGLAASVTLLTTLGGGGRLPFWVVACTAGLAAGTAWFVSRTVTLPLAQLREAAKGIGRNHERAELERPRDDEFGEVATLLEDKRQSVHLRLVAAERAQDKLEKHDKDRDRSERHERALRRAQKMEAIGRLAGGIAHDFNNMLSIVLGYSGIALDGLRPEDPLFLPLSEIKRAGERSAELTQRLLALSRHQVLETKVLDAATLVEGLSRSIRRVLGEHIELTFQSDGSPCKVEVARAQFERVVMNLVLNARDAMPTGGTLTVDIRTVEVSPEDTVGEPGLQPGHFVRIRVTDTGVGMSPEVEERIFEPFFTTKEPGNFAGLGLSTVFGCVAQHGGHVGVRTALGEGTSFDIYLPEATVRAVPSREMPSSGATRAARTILVVEDEAQVRAVVEKILRRHRYGVLVAGSPQEAMSISEGHPGKIDLLVTDVAMPAMNGQVLAERLLERRPDMKVLYMSGYLSDTVLPIDSESARAFLQKPVTPEALRQKVRGILRSVGAPPSPRGNA